VARLSKEPAPTEGGRPMEKREDSRASTSRWVGASSREDAGQATFLRDRSGQVGG